MNLLSSRDLAWCQIDGQLIFLDLAADRYFRLAEPDNREALAEIECRGLAPWHQPPCLPLPAQWPQPRRTSPAIEIGEFRLADVARALWMQKRAEARLARRSLLSVLLDLRSANDARARVSPADSTKSDQMVRAFEQARLLRSSADRCLPRSIALVLCLRMRGESAHIVIGVKLAPFAAHCWVQRREEVLSDSVEEVLRYTPILVV